MRIDLGTYLPPASLVDVGKLKALFKSRVSSYKFLLFKAILQHLDRSNKSREAFSLSIADLRTEMLVYAWYPAQVFKLNFGSHDTVGESLQRIHSDLFGNEEITSEERARQLFQQHADNIKSLVRSGQRDPIEIAKYRILTPWFDGMLTNKPKRLKRQIISEKSRELFMDMMPLYKLDVDRGQVQLHPDWVDYLRLNFGIVEGWLDMQWLRYLQRNNPNVPSLATKLWTIPHKRDSLKRQRGFWQPMLDAGFNCIYTGETVSANNFALDHFLPWAWVGHDQLWNLVPVSREVNSTKGARLPEAGNIDRLADAHIRIIEYTIDQHRNASTKLDDYMSGLNIAIRKQVNEARIREAYRNTVEPQLRMAEDRGFQRWYK